MIRTQSNQASTSEASFAALQSANSIGSVDSTGSEAGRLANVTIAQAEDNVSRASGLTQSNSVRAPAKSDILNSVVQTATEALKQNAQFKKDMKTLKAAQASFGSACPRSGYAQSFLGNTLSTMTAITNHYKHDNDKKTAIHTEIDNLKTLIQQHTDPEFNLQPKTQPSRRPLLIEDTDQSAPPPETKNAGFDTEASAKGISDILLSNDEQKIDLLKEVASPLINHLSQSKSLFKRLPMIKAQVKSGDLAGAKSALENAKPLFDNMIKHYRVSKDKKALNAVKEFLNYAVEVSKNTEDGDKFLSDIIDPHQKSSSQTIVRTVIAAAKAANIPTQRPVFDNLSVNDAQSVPTA